MNTTKGWYWGSAAVAIAALLAACAAQMGSRSGDSGISIGGNDLGGVVTGAQRRRRPASG